MNIHRPKQHWGPPLWAFIHTICVIDFEHNDSFVEDATSHVKNLVHVIPCKYCKEKYKMFLDRLPSYDIYKSMELFRWSVDLHNHVNRHLNKPEITYEAAVDLWTRKLSDYKNNVL